jgi:hypothetical protein
MFDATTGASDPWGPVPGQLPDHAPPYDLAMTCDRLFVGTGGSNRIFALDLTDDTGNLQWMLSMYGNAQAVALAEIGCSSVAISTGSRTSERARTSTVCISACSIWTDTSRATGCRRSTARSARASGTSSSPDPQIYVAGGYTTVSNDRRWGIARFTDV